MTTIVANCTLFDGVSGDMLPGRSLLIRDGRIAEIHDRPIASAAATVVDVAGRTVMPGLIDAHFHAYAAEVNLATLDRTRPELRALYARKALEDALQRGFTTVRDAAGGDLSLAVAIERGLIRGPRFFYSGLALSQTGGHGDMRGTGPDCGCGYCGSLTILADGVDEVRKAAREQLRLGATQIKLFLSGGVASPSDPYWMAQYCDDELRAAVHEAATRRTYVMAHAHTAEAAMRCIRNGVRSIEHATILDRATAEAVAAAEDVYAVPTLVTFRKLIDEGAALGLTPVSLAKTVEVEKHALRSLDLLHGAGARIGFGTDLLGPLMASQAEEFALRRQVQPAIDILRSATSVNAALLNQAGELGAIRPGYCADLLVVDGNPLDDVAVLARPERIMLVMKGGVVHKNILPA
ncbi:amidohydrolase [Rhizorhabdus wittichii DC-6]|jgi:imidazolonepropionase-like amidohydrolase|uniref:Amidohydrolase n=2 Tax=Rhizorhabdus wittichii TaxID=160791 RepID=A0A9J9HAM7_RHIWR|nr:amidohydrolase family protein [Rhizorhabdus wittichii]ABQ68080.1 amidohydrolase [Rhizorhabdus wittichii RW1]ARR55016.1 amidohydrolase [Rhizorhabdus wittichii DC-6]QTH21488.1 amidohydrolase family protein [Rhizorhabdus wittichii]